MMASGTGTFETDDTASPGAFTSPSSSSALFFLSAHAASLSSLRRSAVVSIGSSAALPVASASAFVLPQRASAPFRPILDAFFLVNLPVFFLVDLAMSTLLSASSVIKSEALSFSRDFHASRV